MVSFVEPVFSMSKAHNKRIILVIFIITSMALAVGLVLYALKQNINLFYTPTEIIEKKAPLSQTIRVGGMVKKGSIIRGDNLNIQFIVTDFHKELPVFYTGILPDLFREGQGIVILGIVQKNGIFQAHEVLAKHDENYMPPEAKVAMERGVRRL